MAPCLDLSGAARSWSSPGRRRRFPMIRLTLRSRRCARVAARIDGLLDSNVLIALLAEAHEHHAASIALFLGETGFRFAIAAHSYAETYSVLTRRGGPAPFGFAPSEAWAALESVRAATDLVGLTPAQTFDAVRRYAGDGGVGPRLYDRLIGEAAVAH